MNLPKSGLSPLRGLSNRGGYLPYFTVGPFTQLLKLCDGTARCANCSFAIKGITDSSEQPKKVADIFHSWYDIKSCFQPWTLHYVSRINLVIRFSVNELFAHLGVPLHNFRSPISET